MEVGESSRKEVSWIPTTPLKPSIPRTEPICADGEGNQLSQTNFLKTSSYASPHANYADSVVACGQSSSGAGLNMKMQDRVESTCAVTSIGNDSAGTWAKPAAGAVSSLEGVGFVDLLALADAASLHFKVIHPGANNEGKSPLFPDSNSQSDPLPNLPSVSPTHHNVSLEQIPVNTVNYIPQEPQGHTGTPPIASQTSTYFGCCGKAISPLAPPTPDKAIRGESRQVVGMQISVELEKNIPTTNGETPHNRELSEAVTESSLAAVSTPLKENHNPDKGGSHVIDLNQTPTPKQRRKKHRPKVIKEGKPKSARKPVTPKPATPKENPPPKRKYVRKKGLNKASATPPTEVTGESTEAVMSGSTKKSCRRSLNFELTEQPGDETTVPTENVTLHIGKGIGVLEETDTVPSTSLSNINTPGARPNAHSAKNRKRKGVVMTAQNGHEKSETQSRQNNSDSSRTGILTAGLHMGGTNRKHPTITDHADISHMNLIGMHYNELHAYQRSCIQFPDVQKRRRSEKVSTSNNTSGTSLSPTKDLWFATYPHDLYASSSKCLFSCEYNAVKNPVTLEATDRATLDRSHAFESFISFSQTRPTKRRSKTPTRFRDYAIPTTTGNCNILPNQFTRQLSNSDMQTLADGERPVTSIDILVAEKMHASLKKKRTTRENRKKLVIPTFASTNQMHHDFLLNGYQPPRTMSLDAAHEKPWNNNLIMDALTEKFRHLDINARETSSHEQKALVPYKQKNRRDKINQGDGAMVPYEGSFDPIRKRLPRPKVDLDEETDKVWKLLMLDINSHGIDGTDEEKAKWWEEERRVFRGRADSFIARMRLVQGDRRFSQWKGSVVDSVIGVFLTQNVSDHLSSSAFMSLAARFPLKASNECKIHHEEGTSLFNNKPQALIIESEDNTEWDDKILSEPVCCQSSMTKDITEHSEGKIALNSNDSPETTSLADESNCILLKSNEGNTGEHLSSMSKPIGTIITQARQEKPRYGETQRELADVVSTQCSAISSQISGGFSVDQNSEKLGSCSDSNSEAEDLSSIAKHNIMDTKTCFSKLLEMATSTKLYEVNSLRTKSSENLKVAFDLSSGMEHDKQSEDLEKSDVIQASLEESMTPLTEYTLNLNTNSGILERHSFDSLKMEAPSRGFSNDKYEKNTNRSSLQARESENQAAISQSESMPSHHHLPKQSNVMQQIFLHNFAETQDLAEKAAESNTGDQNCVVMNENTEINAAPIKPKGKKPGKDKKKQVDWDNLRVQAQLQEGKREKTADTMDSLDWDAVRCANVNEIADAIKERGMNNMLAGRIKDFLNRLVEEHGSIDLEWLRDVPPDKAKEYLLSIRGLGLKSVECVRLLTLHHLAFPVDTNVGRIAVRLGWVPLQPLPESLQLHLLELYPVLESIQKYLWPRLCKLDQRTLYELHYQMITFGKVFCTKSKPNCNACPMRGECRHFASAFASARLALPGPGQKSIVSTYGNNGSDQNPLRSDQNPSVIVGQSPLPLPESTIPAEENEQKQLEPKSGIVTCEPIIEEPATPETECAPTLENDIEDAFYEDTCEIPTIKLNIEEFTLNLQNYMQENRELQEGMSKALVALTPEVASLPTPKLKNVSRLRTEHHVYELPDSHPLLDGWDKREPDDPCKYLLAIWTPGETANSIEPPESRCSFLGDGQLCNEMECFSCNSIREANSQIVRGTILIPCRTAMRGSFPLNGTYFQVNEVFADHVSSLDPINVPRSLIWNLNRRTVYFGTSIPSIFKGLSTQEIQQCFWRGYVCVRGFERETRAPRPLMARLHFPASKLARSKEKSSAT
ncbi:protein ROS1A isoform X2 [Neltuma alba]|uniref:protein ROS1A isoform X2 n=1 Tax=Neltuma alba TaxID=207710 RepID=UPI0010A2FDC7|nr:protein ROS1A-like isoform X2 [Prosopis alba]